MPTIKEIIYGSREELILFDLLDEDEMEKIIPYLESIGYAKGMTVFKEGARGDFIGFITEGSLEIKKQTEFKGRQIVIGIIGKGSFVGEMALVNPDETRSATAVALEDTELIVLRRDALEAIIEKYPSIAVKILKGLNQVMAIRMKKAIERLAAIF